jgi:hypothetical protein
MAIFFAIRFIKYQLLGSYYEWQTLEFFLRKQKTATPEGERNLCIQQLVPGEAIT